MSVTSHSDLNQSTSQLPDRILQPRSEFREKFNRVPFMFSHNLGEHPLFEIPRLVKLANTLIEAGPQTIRCQINKVPVDTKWKDVPAKEQFRAQLPDYIANIETSDSWLLLYSVQRDPDYKALLDQVVAELEQQTGIDLRGEMTWLDAYIFIASPQAVTHYHIDHESTFLFQIHGERTANLFDGHDRSILTEHELEDFYLGNLDAAQYTQEKQHKAYVYPLSPGKGVHHPVCAPHWFKNGNSYSVALGIHFGLRSLDSQAKVHQVNYFLRKLKLKPMPPGRSAWRDQLKVQIIDLFSKRQPETKLELLYSGVGGLRSAIAAMTKPAKLAKHSMRQLKQQGLRTLTAIPIVSDYYHYYWRFPRHVIAFRGVYNTFADAVQALPPHSRIGHDQPGIHNQQSIEITAAIKPGELKLYDYPILTWLASAFADSSNVFDFGGYLGQAYYVYQKYVPYPQNLRWVVCDLPEVVKAGKDLASQANCSDLSFTVDFADAERTDILLTGGTVQYVEASLAELIEQLSSKPRHLLINQVPLYEGRSFVTLQNLVYAIAPYKIQNRGEFITSLTALGYELIDSWQYDRTCYIPFHPDRRVTAYYGFYFRRS